MAKLTQLMLKTVLRQLPLLTLALWWGGLTFYSAIVVPIGADRFGATDQGFVTRDVTRVLNGLGAIAALAWGVRAFCDRNRLMLGAAATILATVGVLALLHVQLDSMLDHAHSSVDDGPRFYFWHRLYLLGTASQWLVGVIIFLTPWRERTLKSSE